jgi:hypothetical protein
MRGDDNQQETMFSYVSPESDFQSKKAVKQIGTGVRSQNGRVHVD